MTTPNNPAATLAETGSTSSAKRSSRKAQPKKAAARKESRGEEIIHELFRLAKVDLRASDHGTKLAREFASLLKEGK